MLPSLWALSVGSSITNISNIMYAIYLQIQKYRSAIHNKIVEILKVEI